VNAHQIVEAVLFASDAPLTADEIARADEMLDEDQVEDALNYLRAEYDDAARSFELIEVAEGYQLLTRPEFAPYLERFDNVPRPSRLSGPALETLAIIAYRQPIGRIEVEYIRGVGASGVIRSLQDRRLIEVVGRAEGLGRPLLYGTTSFFLEHFGFKSLEDLPRPDELPIVLRDRIPLGPETGEEDEAPAEGDAAAVVAGGAVDEPGDGGGDAAEVEVTVEGAAAPEAASTEAHADRPEEGADEPEDGADEPEADAGEPEAERVEPA
jgi:segregation and condensation protein B